MADAVVGAIPTVPVGTVFPDRKAAMQDALHRSWGRGIDYDGKTGLSVAIALNEGYEDDEDLGSVIFYTGEGGQDASRRRQVKDQEWTGGNQGLSNAHRLGAPVRVLRGPRLKSPYACLDGYRYDGLYAVTDVWMDTGKNGYRICRFKLEAIDPSPDAGISGPSPSDPVARKAGTVLRQIRDTAMARRVKELHKYRCQVCGVSLDLPGGGYAEGAHIIPLGRPHNGPDTAENLLCLCPNDHVRFDAGAIAIDNSLRVVDPATRRTISQLRTHASHTISTDALQYHWDHVAVIAENTRANR